MSPQKALDALEALFRRNGYEVRYAKGTFRGGACRLLERRIVLLNRAYPPAGRVYALATIATHLREKLELKPEEEELLKRYGL